MLLSPTKQWFPDSVFSLEIRSPDFWTNPERSQFSENQTCSPYINHVLTIVFPHQKLLCWPFGWFLSDVKPGVCFFSRGCETLGDMVIEILQQIITTIIYNIYIYNIISSIWVYWSGVDILLSINRTSPSENLVQEFLRDQEIKCRPVTKSDQGGLGKEMVQHQVVKIWSSRSSRFLLVQYG